MDQNNNQNTGTNPTVQPINTATSDDTRVDQSYTVDYHPNVATSEKVSPVAPVNGTLNSQQSAVNQTPNVSDGILNQENSNSQVKTETNTTDYQQLTIPNPNGEEPNVVSVPKDIRKIEERETQPDGLKFIGIVFVILIVFVFLLPYVYQLLK